MLTYALRRTAGLIPLLLLVMLMLFLILELTPYDAATAIAGETASPEQVEELRQELGLDAPWWERFGDSVTGMIVKEDADNVTVQTGPSDALIQKVKISEIRERQAQTSSMMPMGLLSSLSKEQILDLLAYLEAGGHPQPHAHNH